MINLLSTCDNLSLYGYKCKIALVEQLQEEKEEPTE